MNTTPATPTIADIVTKHYIGKFVIVRCNDAGVHAGTLIAAEGRSAALVNSRRLWGWKPDKQHVFLSGIAVAGLDYSASSIGAPIDVLLTENCEIILCSDKAAESIAKAPIHKGT